MLNKLLNLFKSKRNDSKILMTKFGLEISPSYTKHPELVRLWNEWIEATSFMSVNNCKHPTWYALVEYGKKHLKEVADFSLDYINSFGTTWSLCYFVDCSFEYTPVRPWKAKYYIPPQSQVVKKIYKRFCEEILNLSDEQIEIHLNTLRGNVKEVEQDER